MKTRLRSLFSPLLNRLEAGDEDYIYKPSHRIALLVIGFFFALLGTLNLILSDGASLDNAIPVMVFYAAALITLGVGSLGNDRAVAKIWGSK